MRCYICIDGESAMDLLACGPKDLKSYFLPEYLRVKEEDVVSVKFEEILPLKPGQILPDYRVHPDNFSREEQ